MTLEQLQAQLQLANGESSKDNLAEAELLLTKVLADIDASPETQEREWLLLRAKALGSLGDVVWRRGDYTVALEYYNSSLVVFEQLADKSGVAKSLHGIAIVYFYLSDFHRALEYYGKALAGFEELSDKRGAATVTGNIGNVYQYLSDYPRAMEYYSKALVAHEEVGDKGGMARVAGNIANVYSNLSDYALALEYNSKALAVHEELGEKGGIAQATGNIGNVYASLLDYPRALEYYVKALAIYEELGNKAGVAVDTGNIGSVYLGLGDFAQSLLYFQKALLLSEEIGARYPRLHWLLGLGQLYAKTNFDGYSLETSKEYLHMAISDSKTEGVKHIARDATEALYSLLKQEEQWKEALEAKEEYDSIKEEINIEEAKKQAERIDYERKTAEREKQIAVERAKHEATEQLLHNVLPPSIAQRMVSGEQLIAEKLDSVSVLFADIVGFTKLSAHITPEELVAGLDRIFTSFDELAEKHGLEKIKTIGDAYMVVAGAPIAREDHAQAMAQMAIEMSEAMHEFRSITTGGEMHIRIGIHSGEVVAGVIGKKKFAYDLWGDAVNTASRMESHGEAGKIHVSEDFKNMLGADFKFIPRDEIDIKGKGKMQTYFLEKL